MGKKSDKREKKAGKEKLEKKHGKEKKAKKGKSADCLEVIKSYLKQRSRDGKVILDMESRFNVSFNVLESKVRKGDCDYRVRVGLPKDKSLLLVSVAKYANEMLSVDYAELNRILMSKVKFIPEISSVECCIVMLLDNMISEKQISWSMHKLIMDCDYSAFYSKLHRKPADPEESPEDEDEMPVPDPEEVSRNILDHLMSAAAGKSESEPQPEAPAEPDGTVSAAEERESMSILSKLLGGALSGSQPESESEPQPEVKPEKSDKGKSEEGYVSVSKADMLEAIFGKHTADKKPTAPDDPKNPPDETGDTDDSGDTDGTDDTDDTDGSDG